MVKKREDSTDELVGLRHLVRQMDQLETDKISMIDALRTSELAYRRLFEAAPDGILILSAETGKIMDANPFLENLLQYPRREVIGHKIWEVGPFRETGITEASFGDMQGYFKNASMQLESRDGRRIDVEFVSNVYLVDDKRVIQCNIRDVTSRKKAETALYESEIKLRHSADNLPTFVAFIDTTERYQFVNQAFKNWFGVPSKEAIGKTIREIKAHQGYKIIAENVDFILSGRNMLHKDVMHLPDGKAIYYEANYIPNRNESGEIEGCCILIRDITELKTLEDKLREARYHLEWLVSDRTSKIMEMNRQLLREIEERRKTHESLMISEDNFTGFIDIIGVGAALINPNMEILALNDQMKKWFPHVDTSKTPYCFEVFNIPGRDGICHYCPTWKTLQDGQIHEAITETPKDGAIINYRVVSSPIKDKNGQITAAIEMIDDVTNRESVRTGWDQSESDFQTIFETTGNATVMIEEDATISMANSMFLKRLGYSKSELEGQKRITDLILTEDLSKFRKYYIQRTDPNESLECHFIDKNQNKIAAVIFMNTLPGRMKKVISLYDITELKRLEEIVNGKERELQLKGHKLEEINTALAVLLKRRETDNTEMEEKILTNVNDLIRPYLEKLNKGHLDANQRAYVRLIEDNISNIISPFLHNFSNKYPNLTPQEIQVAAMIKNGKTSKEMAELLNISERTVNFHREHIRKKLGLANKKVNLRSHLLSMA
jgi:PAS domain S-box-containing protein